MFCFLIRRRQRRLWVSALATTFFTLAAISQAAENSTTGKHFLWRVTNARAPFYLLGSIHALRQTDYSLPPVINQAIQESHQYWLEIDPRRGDLFEKKLKETAKYPKGVHLSDKVNPKTCAYLRKITKMGWGSLQDFKPWAIAMFGLQHPGFAGVRYTFGVDSHVFDAARMHGRPIGGIETIDEHVRVLSDMQDIESEVFLLQSLVYVDQNAKQMPEELAAWKSGDTDRLYAMSQPQMKEAPTVWWRLLDRRNARWIPRIELEIKSGVPTLMVAGALHFCGPHGVIAMLRARGYKIEQL
jgi:uncharacterized protein